MTFPETRLTWIGRASIIRDNARFSAAKFQFGRASERAIELARAARKIGGKNSPRARLFSSLRDHDTDGILITLLGRFPRCIARLPPSQRRNGRAFASARLHFIFVSGDSRQSRSRCEVKTGVHRVRIRLRLKFHRRALSYGLFYMSFKRARRLCTRK